MNAQCAQLRVQMKICMLACRLYTLATSHPPPALQTQEQNTERARQEQKAREQLMERWQSLQQRRVTAGEAQQQ